MLTKLLLEAAQERVLEEKQMLDISIRNADKVATTEEKKEKFLKEFYTIEEKFDGTKLTLWRNDEDWDPDYTKNWIIAFKNQILYPEEFETVDTDRVKKFSVGISQYKFIHDHLKKVHKDTKSIPKNTEFFIEFIQNKLTTTREYKNKHGLYLIAYSPSKGEEEGGMIITHPQGFFQDKIDEYSKALKLNLPPVVFEGKLFPASEFEKGILNPELKKVWNEFKKEYSLKPYETIKKVLLSFESTIGGKTEGVVLHRESDGAIFKFVQEDQYDKGVRRARKDKYNSDPDVESEYWRNIRELNIKLFKDLDLKFDSLSYRSILKKYSAAVNSLSDKELKEIFKDKFNAMRMDGKLK